MATISLWATDPQDTYYKFTTTASAGATIAPVSGNGGNITLGSNSAATVVASEASYMGTSYTHAANVSSSDAKCFSLNINASNDNPAHVFVVAVASSDRTMSLKYDGSAVDECAYRGSASSAALVELVTKNSGSHIVYSSGGGTVYSVRVVYEKNALWQTIKGQSDVVLDKDADELATLLFFRVQDLAFNNDGIIEFANAVSKLRYSINFKAQKNGTVTINYANPGNNDRTLTVTTFTRPSTAGTPAIVSQTVTKKTTVYANKEFNVTAGTEYVISYGAGATIKSVTFASIKHHVTYNLGDGTGTTPTQADVDEGATFTLHDGETGITAPENKEFDSWSDGTNTYAGGATYTMSTSDVSLTAQWRTKTTKSAITYENLNGADNSANPIQYSEGIGVASFEPLADVEGYTFLGWSPSSISASATGAQTIIAQWCTNINPTLSYNYTTVHTSFGASILPTITGNTGDGDVTYEGDDDAVATVNAATGEITPVAAGTMTVTATIAAQGGYCEKTAEATITVVAAPTHIIENRIVTTKDAHWGSSIYTTDNTNIKNLSAFNAATENVTELGTANGTRSARMASFTTKQDADYMVLSFTVADGKRLEVSNISIPAFSAFEAKTHDAELSDGTTSVSVSAVAIAKDAEANVYTSYNFSASPKVKGNVTLKLWTYGGTNGYRLNTPIYIDGTITDIPTALDNTDDDVKAVKYFKDGQLFIEKNGHVYNVFGACVK